MPCAPGHTHHSQCAAVGFDCLVRCVRHIRFSLPPEHFRLRVQKMWLCVCACVSCTCVCVLLRARVCVRVCVRCVGPLTGMVSLRCVRNRVGTSQMPTQRPPSPPHLVYVLG